MAGVGVLRPLPLHPITAESFAIIDAEFGPHDFSAAEYAIIRRVIHTTADFDYRDRLEFSPGAIALGMAAIAAGLPLVVDVTMVEQGIRSSVAQRFHNPVISAITLANPEGDGLAVGQTRSAAGMVCCIERYPEAIYVVGNAPTALLALSRAIDAGQARPALVVAAPVGFVSVVESKAAIAAQSVPQIRVAGRKGGSPVAAAIVNALVQLASEGDREALIRP